MASQGWEKVTSTDIARMVKQRTLPTAAALASKPAKYRNVKTLVDGERFDSQREAEHWIALRILEKAGTIMQLRRQVPHPLYAAARDVEGGATGVLREVCRYISDFEWYENGQHVVADAKGIRTKEYLLKRKWLELQDGITIREL